jgi:hypothetical protein
MYDTLHALLYLGRVSREAIGYGKVRGDQDHSWSTFKKLDTAFRAKHPEHVTALNEFMAEEKRVWGSLNSESFKIHSLSKFVSENNIRS